MANSFLPISLESILGVRFVSKNRRKWPGFAVCSDSVTGVVFVRAGLFNLFISAQRLDEKAAKLMLVDRQRPMSWGHNGYCDANEICGLLRNPKTQEADNIGWKKWFGKIPALV